MILVTVAKAAERSRVVADNYRVHALGNGDLPGIVLAHSLSGSVLAKRRAFGMLMPDGLPTEGTKHLANRGGVRCTLQHLSGSHRRNPKLCSRIASGPPSRGPTFVRSDLVKEVDDE